MSVLKKQCECSVAPRNPGQSGCLTEATREVFKIYTYYENSDGVINSIPAGTVIDEDYVIGKLNETDVTKRWYITPRIENLLAPPPEAETESIGNKEKKTGEEIRQAETYEHVKGEANPALIAFYDSIDCIQTGEFGITRTGQVTGMNDGNGNLIPVKHETDTLKATYGKATQGVTQKVFVSYMVDQLENDANRDHYEPTTIEFSSLKWFSKQPLEAIAYNVTGVIGSFSFTLNGLYGGVGFKSPFPNIVTADISPDFGVTTGEVFNVTQDLNEAGTLVEGDPGEYVFTYAAPVALDDVIEFDIFKSGVFFRTVSFKTS